MTRPVPIPIHISSDIFHELTDAVGEGWFGEKSEAVLSEALHAWLATHSATITTRREPEAGYQWKELFLPEGTLLRTTFNGQTTHAEVQGDRILCNDQALSSSQFANQLSGGGRNAWKVIWLRLPRMHVWRRAIHFRTEIRR